MNGGGNNPGAFYFSDAANEWDWTAPQNDNLWRDGAKTLFDPCPEGWRVPQSGDGELSPWQYFTAENGPWQGEAGTAGCLWNAAIINGGTAWYPISGERHRDMGRFSGIGSYNCTVTSTSNEITVFYFVINPGIVSSFYATGLRANGLSVRCVRE